MQYYEEIRDYIGQKGFVGHEEIVKAFPKADVAAVLASLEENADILLSRKKKYALPEQLGYLKGLLEIKRGGFGFVRAEEGGDVFVGASQLGGAFHGETVLVKITKEGGKNHG